ncbi:MAG: PQQ-dependent sugar dehydrogenase [Planctomycetales bacterium]
MQTRVPWTTSRVIGSPDPPLPYHVTRAWPSLKFEQPIGLYPEPGSSRLILLEYSGKLRLVTLNPEKPASSLWADLGQGLPPRVWYSLTFHPRYLENGLIYVFSNGPNAGPRKDRLASYQTTLVNGERTLDPKSEKLVLEWDSGGHDGGDVIFGPEGYLYVTTGDGTSSSDVNNSGQRIDDLPASVLRIDVDHPENGKPYRIPPDNPFLNVPGARGEVYAFGLRNPWRMSYDPPSQQIWIGDVGQDTWEMIYLLQRGANYGWSRREGSHDFRRDVPQGPAPFVNPIAEHHHSESRCITGGYVYRGKKHPDLIGCYIYCDYDTGKVWGLKYENGKVTSHRELADTTYKVGGFGRDHEGELYLIAYAGELLQLTPTPPAPPEVPTATAIAKFPRKLSDTGLFTSVPEHRMAPGVIPYDVNSPLWSDGALKERYMAIPGEGKIEVTNSRGWNFPDGTVMVKSFALEIEPGNPRSRKRIETRLLTKQEGEWVGYSYEWNDEQTDATLVEKGGKDRDFKKQTGSQKWHYPSRAECMVCHSRAAQYVLGLTTMQMNRDHDYDGVTDNQLRAFDHVGLFAKPLEKKPTELPRLVDPHDPRIPLETRVRSYLHANCSSCHVPDGGGNARFDVEFTTELHATKLVNVSPTQGDFGIVGAHLIAPGTPDKSILFRRISSLPGQGRMPPLATAVIDQHAVDMLHAWITTLTPIPPPAELPYPEP